MEDIMNKIKIIVWVNYLLGFYNLYLYSIGDKLFNLIVGTLNIGVWVFFRRMYNGSEEKKK